MAEKTREKVMRTCATRGCGVEFDAATSYSGDPHAPVRKYHAEWCRDIARNDVRREQTEHLNRYAGLRELHDLEANGQLPLVDEPLPEVPARPSLVES